MSTETLKPKRDERGDHRKVTIIVNNHVASSKNVTEVYLSSPGLIKYEENNHSVRRVRSQSTSFPNHRYSKDRRAFTLDAEAEA